MIWVFIFVSKALYLCFQLFHFSLFRDFESLFLFLRAFLLNLLVEIPSQLLVWEVFSNVSCFSCLSWYFMHFTLEIHEMVTLDIQLNSFRIFGVFVFIYVTLFKLMLHFLTHRCSRFEWLKLLKCYLLQFSIKCYWESCKYLNVTIYFCFWFEHDFSFIFCCSIFFILLQFEQMWGYGYSFQFDRFCLAKSIFR